MQGHQRKDTRRRGRLLPFAQWVFAAVGVVLLAIYTIARFDGYVGSQRSLRQFDSAAVPANAAGEAGSGIVAGKAKKAGTARGSARQESGRPAEAVDFTLWSPGRVLAYRGSLGSAAGMPIAVLQVPKIHLRVPVFDNTGELALNRGVGHIRGTAAPGENGNVGLAGHRDGFFRGLKDLRRGDDLQLRTSAGVATYLVDKVEIVSPTNVGVLRPRATPSLTLVTCYPFYYIGSAPKRFVVEASLANPLRGPMANPGHE